MYRYPGLLNQNLLNESLGLSIVYSTGFLSLNLCCGLKHEHSFHKHCCDVIFPSYVFVAKFFAQFYLVSFGSLLLFINIFLIMVLLFMVLAMFPQICVTCKLDKLAFFFFMQVLEKHIQHKRVRVEMDSSINTQK